MAGALVRWAVRDRAPVTAGEQVGQPRAGDGGLEDHEGVGVCAVEDQLAVLVAQQLEWDVVDVIEHGARVSNGEELDLELRSIDAVGNTSTARAVELTVEPDDPGQVQDPAAMRDAAVEAQALADDPPPNIGPCFPRVSLARVRHDEDNIDYQRFRPELSIQGLEMAVQCTPLGGILNEIEVSARILYQDGSVGGDPFFKYTWEDSVTKRRVPKSNGTIKTKVGTPSAPTTCRAGAITS